MLQGTNTVDLGAISSYEKKTVEYLFKNRGENTIKVVKLVATCSCLSAEKDRDIIKPGEKLLVKVHLDPKTVHDKFKRIVWLIE